MTTTASEWPIASVQDIMDALEQNPDFREAVRRHTLDEEIRQLPAIVRELQRAVADLTQTIHEYIAATDARLERLEAGQAELKSGLARMEERQDRTEERQTRMEERQTRMEERQTRMEERQTRMEERQTRMEERQDRTEERQTRTEERQTRTEERQTRMEGRQDRMEGHISNLRGTDYERRAARRARRAAQRRLNLLNATVLYAITVPDNDTIPELLDRAVAAGRITEEQLDEVEDADVILGGNPADAPAETAYVIAEVSLAIADNDIDRAAERAGILARAGNVPVRAVVIGTAVPDGVRQYALQRDVEIVIMPE